MEKVSIIDIQGVQWAVKDQEATERLNKLEEKTNIKKTRLWEKNSSYLELVEINNIKFYNVFFEYSQIVNTIGQVIFTIPIVGQKNIVNRILITGDKTNNKGRVPLVLEINKDGTVRAYAILDDIKYGEHEELRLYGQAFQLID